MERQTKRFTPVHSKLRWQTLRRLTSGCQGDYIATTAESSSLRIPQVLVNETDPVEVLETGLPVMYYNPMSKTFENRVVKIDNQLSFFFVLEERALKEPCAVRLYGIEEVLSSSRAMEVLEEFDVHDEYATEKTAVVVIHTRPDSVKKMALTMDRVIILVAPPAMKLVDHLSECVELSKTKFSADADDEEGVRLKDSGRYLDCARIGSCASVFFHYSPGVDLEFTLRPADVVDKQDFEIKVPIAHALHFPMDAAGVNTELNHLVERLGILPALDLTRLKLVMYEMVIHRQWITPHMRLFKGGMYDFMQDQDGLNATFKIEREVQQRIFERVPAPRVKMDVHHYSARALDATILALRHLLSLEDVHASVERGRPVQPEDILHGIRIFSQDYFPQGRDSIRNSYVPRLRLSSQLSSQSEKMIEEEELPELPKAKPRASSHEEPPSRKRHSSFYMLDSVDLEDDVKAHADPPAHAQRHSEPSDGEMLEI